MKSNKHFMLYSVIVLSILLTSVNLSAQDNSSISFDAGTDIVSNYIWRGTKFGTGPAVQPFIEFSAGNFTVGSWGSFGVTLDEAAEADLYLSYGFDFGLSVGLTDYYYPGTEYFDYSSASGSHGFEINLGYELEGISVGANYMLNEAPGAGTAGGDMYFELGYSLNAVSLFVGAGNGWHTTTGDFALTNVGLSVSKELALTESFSLPLTGTVILNPETEQFYVVVGVSF
ncbi:MAG: TorF family putative porin [Bacteroidales bacterium]